MEEIKDVSNIHDEDVLRQMWQETEDFSRKKEIRSHMYKLREARLKEFYTSGEVLKDVQRSNSSPGLRDQPCAKIEGPTHADSLADHSFLSLKTKEIRDSESPTRDVQYRNSKNRETDGEWTMTSNTSKSDDGKTITSSQRATTQGVRAIDGGQLAYAAANEHQASVFADGDDNNYTRSMGESSKTFAEQNVVTGDENNFRSNKTTSSSTSSKIVTHHSSTTEDVGDLNQLAITGRDQTDDGRNTTSVRRTIYTSVEPEEFITSNRSVNTSEKIRNIQDSKSSEIVYNTDDIKDGKSSTTVTKTTYTSGDIPDDLKKSIADGNTKVYTETKTLPDGSTVTTTRYETKGSKKFSSTSGSSQVTSNRQTVEQKSSTSDNKVNKHQIDYRTGGDDDNTSRTVVTTKTIRETYDDDNSRPTNRNDIHKTETVRITSFDDDIKSSKITDVQNECNITRKTENVTKLDRKVIGDQDTRDIVKITRTIEDQLPAPDTKEIHTTVTTTKTVKSNTENEPRSPTKSKPEDVPSPTRSRPQQRPQERPEERPQEMVKSCKPEETYKPSSPTDGQYSTTYRSEFTNKRISVDVSPTHDAFARSLRSISPDRIGDRPKSRGSVRNSTSSLRSSTSPEKHPHPTRMSPERKPGYDRRSPEKYPDQRRHTTSPSRPTEYSPDRKHPRPDSITITRTTETKRKPTDGKSPARTPTSPTKTETTKVTRYQTSPTRGVSPTKPSERTSPLRSPTKDITPVNTDTITRKKKIPTDDERRSPVRSPTKTTTTEITVNTDIITRKKKVPQEDDERGRPVRKTVTEVTTVSTDTITKKKKKPTDDEPCEKSETVTSPKKLKEKITTDETEIVTNVVIDKSRKPTSRDLSPTSLASDIEFINHNRHIVTDLDEPCEAPEKRPTSLEITETTITTKKNKQIASSPVKKSPTKSSPVKEVPKKFKPSAPELDSPSDRPPSSFPVPDDFDQICEVTPKDKPPLKRTETYEERCRQMLGLPEPDTIPKKEYVDMYAGMEPVEEPMIVKKHVTPLGPIGPEDELIHETLRKINERKPEIPDDEVKPNAEEFIKTERREVESVRKPTKDRKSPEKQKPQKPEDGEYNTEYTDEYCDKPVSENSTNKKTPKPITEPKDKKPTSKASSPQRKSPEKKIPKDKEPTEGEYNTEYADEYCERTQKPTTVNKPSNKSPERKPQQSKLPQKKRPEDMEFSTEYTDEYCEVTGKVITKKPAGKKTEPAPKPNDIALVRGIPSPTKRTPETKSPSKITKGKPDSTNDEELEVTTDKKINRKSPSPVRRIPVLDRTSPSRDYDRQSPNRGLPENKSVTEYINEYCDDEREGFINREKYDTDITLEVTKQTEKPTKLIDIEFDIENENIQDVHIRTHRIDTTNDSLKPRETSPRRQPQRAVPSDTMECTFKRTVNEEDERVMKKKPEETKKKPQRTPEDRKSPVKQLNRKESVPKTTTVKTITKKVSSPDIDTKRKEETTKKKLPKEKSPERYERPKARSPSPTCRTVNKTERNVTRKISNKEIPLKKAPSSPVRKPAHSSPERKPLKPISKTSPTQKHVVTKTISLTSRPDTKPQPSSPVKTAPKTTVKPTKVNQPSSVTVTTVKTTKTTKKTVKPQQVDSDSSESEYEEIVDVSDTRVNKKKVVTTASIKISNGVAKQPSPSRTPNVTMPSIKVNTNNVTTIPSTDSVTKKDQLTTKCITTKSIILNQNDIEDIEFIIDLQRSTSSREPSPDKVCPIPVSSEDEGSYPRYPDQVSEPDDLPSRRRPAKIADIPLTEEEDVKNFSRISEVTETTRKASPRITDIDKVTETDESLLSVTEKVSRFITTAEKLTEDEPKSKTPAPRVPRPELVIDENLEDDECLLSVSDKVTKFITTAEHVSTKPAERQKSPKPRERTPVDVKVNVNDECLLSVNQKVSHFIQAAETVKQKPSPKEGPAPRVNRPDFTVDEKLKTDECLLSVSDKVSKFLSSAEKLTTDVKTTIKREPSPEKTAPRREFSPEKIAPRREFSPEKAPRREYSPEKISPRRESPEKITRTQREPTPEPQSRQSPIRKVSEPYQPLSRPKSEPVKPTETKPVNLKSSEAVRKAKAMFENISKTQDVPKQRDILGRPSIWEGRKKPEVKPDDEEVKLTDIGVYKKPEVKKQLIYSSEDEETCRRISTNLKDVTLKSTKLILNENRNKPRYLSPEKDIPGYMKPIQKPTTVLTTEVTVEKKIQRSRSPNPNGEVPGYMKPINKHSPEYEEPERRPIQRSRSPNPTGEVPRYMKPIIKPSPEYEEPERRPIHRSRSPNPNGELPGYMKPINKHSPEYEEADRPIQRSRSPNPSGEAPGYMRSIPKVSPEERDQYIIETRYRETLSPEIDVHKKTVEEREEIETHRTKHYENGDIPHYMLPLQRNISPDRDVHKKINDDEIEIVETVIERHRTPERDIPGYMKPLQRHGHSHSPDREEKTPADVTDDGPRAGKKFGVTLRRTDSGRVIQSTTSTTVTERRRSSTPGTQVIEDIQDLEILERMMDKVLGYEQRRRIRAQIRVVKKLISENKIEKSTNQKRTKTAPSPIRDAPASKSSPSPCDRAPQDRRSPMRDPKRSSVSPSKKTPDPRQKSPEPRHKPIETKSSFSTITTTQKSERVVIHSSKDRSYSPEPKKKAQPPSSMYNPDLKHVKPALKTVQDDKPSWVTNRNLKKTTNETVTEKRVHSPVKKIDTNARRSPSPQKDAKPTDCITSSYGIGPTDENGQPLFGIRALRNAATDSNNKVHVRGTVVTSQFYSENGQEPVGEVTVTKYSNNPRELHVDDEDIKKSKGLASVTTTQKFGSRGTPTLGSLVDKKKAITEKQTEEDEIFKTTSTKVTRRGSVKALSQKFIENAAEISRNERQAYPKAGLILRTSSFKDTTQSSNDQNSSRESSPGAQNRSGKISLESITSDSRQQPHSVQDSSSTTTKTFLNSHTRVANAQEVITRMKNAEKEHIEGDSVEDREARMLLNKFLGAQVLMSGMEPLLTKSTSVTTSSTSAASAQLVRKVQKSKTTTSTTTKETSKPLSLTKRFQTPITTEALQDIWDEQTLRALLEQCTDYEERRAIRARLRQVMAEQEAVANVVANAVSESGDRTLQERIETSKKSISQGPVTTTHVSTTRVIQSRQQVSKPISPFAKFRQLDKQNSLNTPPSSPRTPTGTGAPLFKFTDPALSQSASTVKDRLLHWCQMKTKEYQNIKLENFSTSWADGMAFCALIHHFLPDAFDYHILNPKLRRQNFTLAFRVADEQADIAPLLDVDDMVAMRRPDWKCVFTYVQSIYRRFKDED